MMRLELERLVIAQQMRRSVGVTVKSDCGKGSSAKQVQPDEEINRRAVRTRL